MSVLGKYRKDDKEKDDTVAEVTQKHPSKKYDMKPRHGDSVPNRERRSPIMSFSVAVDLRLCLQAIRNERAINLSMWVERKLREAVIREFSDIAEKHLD